MFRRLFKHNGCAVQDAGKANGALDALAADTRVLQLFFVGVDAVAALADN